LEGREILGAKRRAVARGLRWIIWFLVPLWLVGVICGALHPLGVILGAVDLALAIWLSLCLGLWLGIRPWATSTAISASSYGALAITVFHVFYLWMVLEPARAISWGYAEFRPVPRLLIVAGLVPIPLVTALLAHAISRRAFDGFDRYVNRPCRGGSTVSR
ncbi:MAG: hypothetical protein AB7I30_00495, partial [Isosphaeraceae bacterium]